MKESPRFGRAAVAAPHHLASEAGRAVLAQGGNAIEAMVAMGAAIAVVYPHMTGIGGDGFWLIREPSGKMRALDASGYAGSGATIKAYHDLGLGVIPVRGAHAALTVPGAVGGWRAALELSRSLGGKLPVADILHAAIGYARDGIAVSKGEGGYTMKEEEGLHKAPGFADQFMQDGARYKAGVLRKLPALAATLSQLAHAGLEDYYQGDIGREIAHDFGVLNGFVTREDLTRYQTHWRTPLQMKAYGATLYNHPPSSQGLAQLLMLGIAEKKGLHTLDDAECVHALVEIIKRVWRIRDAVVTDFDRLTHDPQSFLTAQRFEKEASAIADDRAAPYPLPDFGEGDTVWMGAIDGQGCAVSYIQSIFWEYGSGVVLPRTGILLQNRGTAFSLNEKAKNPLQPGRRPFHTLNPPMAVFDDGRVMSYGTMGGDPQPQITAQTFMRRVVENCSVAEAIDRPRLVFGRAWGADQATVKLERRIDPSIAHTLEKRGHVVEWFEGDYVNAVGHAGMLVRDPKTLEIEADHDPRADGGALGI